MSTYPVESLAASELNLKPEETVRIYADISKEAEMKLRVCTLLHQQKLGKKITRKEYLEKLIADDIARVKGASLREVVQRAKSK